jgi:flagellar FliL protein
MAEVEKQESKTEEKDMDAAPPADGEGSPEGGDGAEGQEGGAKKSNKKKLIALVLAVILIAGGATTFIIMKKKKEEAAAAEQQQAEESTKKKEPIFHDMDEMIINLNTEGKNVSFMKLKITLEVEGQENVDALKKMMPKISDVFQMYLRELRPADMQGSVGLYRLKEELLLRVNKIVYPAQVNDLLFKEVLVQ